ncbi:MAG: c-type cytochrome [Fluviicola sp.]
MNPELTKLIEQYLAGELTANDTKAFENRMATNETLRTAVEEQKEIHAGAKRAYQRQKIESIGKRYHFLKNLLRGGLSILIVGAITAASVFLYHQLNKDKEIPVLTEEVKSKLDKQAPMDLETQYFIIPEDGGVVLSEDGVLISVPKGAFTLNGKPYKKPLAVQFQEAIDPADIMQGGLNTTSNGKLLETGGMISVTGYTIDGKPLDFNPKVGVYVQVPMQDLKSDMQLYDGVLQADGSINWIQPEPLEKIPVPVPMNDLDFYPKGYENYLDKQKWKTAKKSRDSLYLSFEEEGCYNDRTLFGKKLFDKVCSVCHHPTHNGTGPALAGVRDLYKRNGVGDEGIIAWVRNWQKASESDDFMQSRTQLKASSMIMFGDRFSDEQILSIFEYIDEVASDNGKTASSAVLKDMNYEDGQPSVFQFAENTPKQNVNIYSVQDDVESDTTYAGEFDTARDPNYIYPSNVLAFWNKGFNNTNLATREFERRMRFIHGTCDNAVLKVYTSNLDKSLKECDERVAAMGHYEFELFAAENIGKVNASNPHVKQLQKFYEKSIKQLKGCNKTLQKMERNRRAKHDKETRKSREDEAKRTRWREQQAFQEEFNFNLDNVYQQLGMTRGFTIRSASQSPVERRPSSAIKNIDRLVDEATRSRSTLTIEKNGKTAEIVYNDFSFEVANSDEYIKLYAYVLPFELNSYQRIEGINGTFSHPLNDAFRYNIAVVGIREKGYGFFKQLNIKEGNLGTIKLRTVSKNKLDADVKHLNSGRNVNPMRIQEELAWLGQEQKDYKEQKMRKEMAAFREEIRNVLFPCCSTYQGQGQQGQGAAEAEDGEEENDFGLD